MNHRCSKKSEHQLWHPALECQVPLQAPLWGIEESNGSRAEAMFLQPPKISAAGQMAKFYRAAPFNIGFRNAPVANANPGYFPCPLVAGPLDGYWSGMMSGVITPEEMDEVTIAFNKEMAHVHRRDNHEELRALILERLWLRPYGRMREEQRKRAEKQKERREYHAYVQRLKERELEKKVKTAKKRAAPELEEGEVEEPPVKQEQMSPSLAPKRGRAATASWRTAAGAKKRARVIQDDDDE